MTKRSCIPLAGVAFLAAAPIAVLCTGPATATSTRIVTMRNISLSPAKVTIKKGDRVRWTWKDGRIRHDVTWRNGAFRASRLQAQSAAKPYSVTFKSKGTFRYYCSVHPGDMQGAITVR